MTTPRLGMPEIAVGQTFKETAHNDALRMVDALMSGRAISMTLTTPPGSPAEGDVYIVPASATGAWSGQTGKIAHFYGNAWYFYTPKTGMHLWLDPDKDLAYYTGSAWSTQGGGARYVVNPASATCVIPTLSAGTTTASQSGTTITVTCSVAHNISSAAADRLSGTGALVYLNMAAGAIAKGFYSNLTVTSTTQFTCTSTVSQTVASQTVTALGTTLVEVLPFKGSMASGILNAKSQIKYNFNIRLANIGVARGFLWRMYPVGNSANGTDPMISENSTVTTAFHKYVDGLVSFLDDKSPSSDYVYNQFGNVGDSANVAMRLSGAGSVTNIRPSAGFEIVPTVGPFGSGATINDWAAIDMARYEFLV